MLKNGLLLASCSRLRSQQQRNITLCYVSGSSRSNELIGRLIQSLVFAMQLVRSYMKLQLLCYVDFSADFWSIHSDVKKLYFNALLSAARCEKMYNTRVADSTVCQAVWFSLTKTKMVKNEKITNSLTKTKTKTKKWSKLKRNENEKIENDWKQKWKNENENENAKTAKLVTLRKC